MQTLAIKLRSCQLRQHDGAANLFTLTEIKIEPADEITDDCHRLDFESSEDGLHTVGSVCIDDGLNDAKRTTDAVHETSDNFHDHIKFFLCGELVLTIVLSI